MRAIPPEGQPQLPAKTFPLWPLATLLVLSLLACGAAWGLKLTFLRIEMDLEWPLARNLRLLWLAGVMAGLAFLLALRRPARTARLASGSALLLLVLFQAGLLTQGGLRRYRQLTSNPARYASRRDYVPIAQRPADWPDPQQPVCFDLGGGVQLAMSTVAFADASQQTLPKAQPRPLPQPAPDPSTRPLTAAGLRNLVALTRAIGYLRFFHPSDAAAGAYWNQWTILGIQALEDADPPQELAQGLQALFAPLAPTAQFLAPGATAQPLVRPAGSTQLVRWRHLGLGQLNERTSFAFSRSVRLADVAILWTTMQHFYPYFEVVPVDWAAELPKALAQAAVAPDPASLRRALRTLQATLRDSHGRISAATPSPATRPAVWLKLLGGRVYVQAGPPDLPRGSELLAVNGELVPQRLARLSLETSAATEGGRNVRLEGRLLSGCPGPMVRLLIKPPQGAARELPVPLGPPLEAPRPPVLAELRPGVWYVDLDRLENAAFAAALPTLARAKGVLFDLRGYIKGDPQFLQHLTGQPLLSAHWLVPIITQPDGRQRLWEAKNRWHLPPLQPRIQGKVVFLTGPAAQSYAESCLGIVEAYRLAEIVGEPTGGTNGNTNPFQLPGGCTASWTGMKVLKHDGSTHHGVGIHPTVWVQATPQGLAEGRDEVLEKGLALIPQ